MSVKELARILLLVGLVSTGVLSTASASICMSNVAGAERAEVINNPPNPVAPDPDDRALLAWVEVEDFTLTESLTVNLVSDSEADFVTPIDNGFEISSGTMVTSYYLQWDSVGAGETVEATLSLESDFVAVITTDQGLAESDEALGRPNVEYLDFRFRGVEGRDTVDVQGNTLRISLDANSPGDWARLICVTTAGGEVPALPCAVNQLPGDCNQDGAQDVSDVVCTVRQLFPEFPLLNGTPPCTTALGTETLLDVNGDGEFNIADVVSYADFLFGGATGLPAQCGSMVAQGCGDNPFCQ